MPNFLSLFTWSFYLPFKYCLKASNYTVCFILRYLILQYTYNISYPNVCHILSEANYHWCRSSFTKDYMTKKYKIRPPTMVKTLTLVFNFVVKGEREGGGGDMSHGLGTVLSDWAEFSKKSWVNEDAAVPTYRCFSI